MNWYPKVLNFTAVEYAKYDECLELFCRWAATAEHIVHTMNFKSLNYATLNFLFRYNLHYNEEITTSNLCHKPLYGGIYYFIINIPVRYKQSESFLSIYYKPPQFLREDKYVGGMPCDKTPGKTGYSNEPNNHGDPNSPKMPVLNEYGIIGVEFILPPQEDDGNLPNDKIPVKTGYNNEPNKHG